jgi:hypothetical protein
MTDKKITAGWIPTDTEGKGETLVLTEANVLELELVQHYGANYDDPDSFLIAIGRRDNDLEASKRRMQDALDKLDAMLALEEYVAGIKQGRTEQAQGGAQANADKKTQRADAITDWVDEYLASRSKTPTASELAGRLLRAENFDWPEGSKPVGKGSIERVISEYLQATQK